MGLLVARSLEKRDMGAKDMALPVIFLKVNGESAPAMHRAARCVANMSVERLNQRQILIKSPRNTTACGAAVPNRALVAADCMATLLPISCAQTIAYHGGGDTVLGQEACGVA